MKNTNRTIAAVVAASAFLAIGNAAQADVVLNYPGSYVFNGGGGTTITADGISGTLTGVRVTFTYQHIGGSSRAYDVSFTAGIHQWGGYFPLINDAEIGERPTGAPTTTDTITYASEELGMGYNQSFVNQTLRVGFGNGNVGGSCTVSNVTIRLLGVVPTPGAAAALSLGGLAFARRRRS